MNRLYKVIEKPYIEAYTRCDELFINGKISKNYLIHLYYYKKLKKMLYAYDGIFLTKNKAEIELDKMINTIIKEADGGK